MPGGAYKEEGEESPRKEDNLSASLNASAAIHDASPAPKGTPRKTKIKGKPKLVATMKAYAKIEGKDLTTGDDIEVYIKSLPATLGRAHKNVLKGFISLGTSSKISRMHATIDFNRQENCFELRVKGKNGATVNRLYYDPKNVDEEFSIPFTKVCCSNRARRILFSGGISTTS